MWYLENMKNIHKLLVTAACAASFVLSAAADHVLDVRSPDGRLTASFGTTCDGALECGVGYAGVAPGGVSDLVVLSIGVFDGVGGGYKVGKITRAPLDSTWANPFGERSVVTDRCDRALVELTRGGRPVTLELRDYDAGFAYRFVFGGSGTLVVKAETDAFAFGGDWRCWPAYFAQDEYRPAKLSELAAAFASPQNQKRGCAGIERPFVVEGPDFVAALGEAANLDYARTKFRPGAEPFTVETLIDSPATVTCPYALPWRYVRIAKDVCGLFAGNDLLLNLNEPSKIADTSWIRPGKVLRVARLDEETGRAAVDFAKKMGLDYIELDAGWYGPEAKCDPLAPKPYVKPILAYAKERGVPVILYVNRNPLKANIDAILPALKGWGAVGIKYGFVDVGAQQWQKWVSDAIVKAANQKLMLDIHDEYRLTGNQRTWPNVLTVEGIRGNEEMPDAAHDCALAFTRYLGGPGDYTPCWTIARVKNSLAHQLALPAVYFSPFQFLYWYQRPADVDATDPALGFWARIPTVWDESRALQGKIGAYAVIARRSGGVWFMGGLNAGVRRTFTVPLDFLGPGAYNATIYRDADPAATNLNQVAVESRTVTAKDAVGLEAASNGGFAVRLEPAAR